MSGQYDNLKIAHLKNYKKTSTQYDHPKVTPILVILLEIKLKVSLIKFCIEPAVINLFCCQYYVFCIPNTEKKILLKNYNKCFVPDTDVR